MITVEELFDGEVSPWFVQVAREGDEFEVRGPFGGWFVWDAGDYRADYADCRRVRAGAADVDAAPSPQRGLVRPRRPGWSPHARPTTGCTRERSSASVSRSCSPTARAPSRWTGYTRRVDRGCRSEVALFGGAHLHLWADHVREDGGQPPRRTRRGPAPRSGPSVSAEGERWIISTATRPRASCPRSSHSMSRRRSRPAPVAARPDRWPRRWSTRRAWARSCAVPRATACCCAYARGGGQLRVEMRGVTVLRWRSELDDPAGVALEDGLGLGRVAGASASASGLRSAAVSIPPSVGLMKPSRSEPSATCCGPIASMCRARIATDSSSVFVSARRRPSLIWCWAKISPTTPPRAASLHDRMTGDVVLLAAEAVARVGGDDRVGARVAAGLRVERLDQRERLVDRVVAHVADVDQHLALVHRLHRGLAELGERGVLVLREDEVVERRRGGRAARARWSRRGARRGGRA